MRSIKNSLTIERWSVSFYAIWFVSVIVAAFIATQILPNQFNYLGGGLTNYVKHPLFWGFSNFDGEHYISIARAGYAPLQHFFFPVYPFAIRFVSQIVGGSLFQVTLSGALISIVSSILFFIGLIKLIKIDYSQKISELTLLLLVTFPASFYFFAVYTESLFLALAVWSFYFARKKNFLVAALLASIASGTKVIGFSLGAALLVEFILQNWPIKISYAFIQKNIKSLVAILFSSSGLLLYMFFLQKSTGDALVFLHKVGVFGDQRSSTLIFLPQVFYRYIFKILPVAGSYWPAMFTSVVEFLVATLFLLILIFSFKTMRKSYWIYTFVGFLVPTLAGSFSSLPRYVIVLFPAFMWLALFLEKKQKKYLYTVVGVFIAVQFVALMLFFRGYWFS